MATNSEKQDYIAFIRFMECFGYRLFRSLPDSARKKQPLLRMAASIEAYLCVLPTPEERKKNLEFLHDTHGENPRTLRALKQDCIDWGLTLDR